MRTTIWSFFLMLALLVTPPAADAEAPARVPTVGVLSAGPAGGALAMPGREAFERGLAELGWVPGRNIRVEYRYAEGKRERLEALARDLVLLGVDVIVARATGTIQAAKQATATIPIVMSAAGFDPIQLGLVASLARPGGNVTGLTLLNQDLQVKHLELLKEAVPRLSRVAVLGNAAAPQLAAWRDLEAAAQAWGIVLHHVEVRGPDDLDRAFADIVGVRAGGLIVRADPFVLEANDKRVIALALRHRLPAVYWLRTYSQAGGLMSYGADLFDIHRRSAFYVDRILRGARPADLPVEEPTKFSLVVNLKAARALGLSIPASVLARANEILQ
jgi:putative ABC transport system substrate-binding protein